MRFRVMAQMRTLVGDRSIRGGPEASTAATTKTKRLNYLQMAGESDAESESDTEDTENDPELRRFVAGWHGGCRDPCQRVKKKRKSPGEIV